MIYSDTMNSSSSPATADNMSSGYDDILSKRRTTSDFMWVTRKYDSPVYRHSTNMTPEGIKRSVLSSPRVQLTIDRLAQTTGRSRDDIEKEATAIIEEMGHKYKLSLVRLWGYNLAKIYKRIYSSIYVESEGVKRFREVSAQYPVILLPTHRSYQDFLLMSYICFHYDTPLPSAASGNNFLNLKAASGLLRHAGGFFIRRKFGDDPLYWALIKEYVHSMISNGMNPIEVFLEGTRSRTGKSLPPRMGFLQACLELFFTSRVPDIMLVPVTITYDRTLEENLYTYEMLGVPKPKETVGSLIKARSILNENYGNIYVKFCTPVSVRDFCDRHIQRSVHSVGPHYLSSVTPAEQQICQELAIHIIKVHHHNVIVNAFPLTCFILSHYIIDKNTSPSTSDLCSELKWLIKLARTTGATILMDNSVHPSDWLKEQVHLHQNFLRFKDNSDHLVLVDCPVSSTVRNPTQIRGMSDVLIPRATVHVLLQQYTNQALQMLEPFCKIALCIMSTKVLSADNLLTRFKQLNKLLQREFPYEPKDQERVFHETIHTLQSFGILSPFSLQVTQDGILKIAMLASQLRPFLEAFLNVCNYFLLPDVEPSKDAPYHCQKQIEKVILKGLLNNHSFLSLDFINSCISCLVSLNAGHFETRDTKRVFVQHQDHLANVTYDLSSFLLFKKPGYHAVERSLLKANL